MQLMPTITYLVDDVEEAAQVLLGNVVLRPGGIPRVANMLQRISKNMRGEKKKAQPKTIKAWVGKKKSKGNEIRVPKDWAKGEW